MEGEAKRSLGGSPVRVAHLAEAVSEILSADDIAGLSATRPRIVRHEDEGDGEEYVLEIMKHPIGVSLGVRSAATPAAKPRAQANTPAQPQPQAKRQELKLDTLDEPIRPIDLETLRSVGRPPPAPAAAPTPAPAPAGFTRDDIVQIARELIQREAPRGNGGPSMSRDDIAAIAREGIKLETYQKK